MTKDSLKKKVDGFADMPATPYYLQALAAGRTFAQLHTPLIGLKKAFFSAAAGFIIFLLEKSRSKSVCL